MAKLTADACAQIVSKVVAEGHASVGSAAPPPNFDALAVSIGAQGNAIAMQANWLTCGSIILALVAIIAGFAWGKIVTATAEREAREAAQACADAHIKKWLEEVAPPLVIRQAMEFLQTLGEATISEDDIAKLVSAAGANEKEGEGGKK